MLSFFRQFAERTESSSSSTSSGARVEGEIRLRLVLLRLFRLLEIDEGLQLILEDAGGQRDCCFGRQRTVRLDWRVSLS